jgi:flagellum-specific ATP synthase
VLTEGDDHNDPVADAARGVLDGHIVLSRSIADTGHYPAIDIESSVSRVMTEVVTPEHLAYARQFRRIYSAYEQNRDFISIGAYQRGSDPRVDKSIELRPAMLNFLQQSMSEAVGFDEALDELRQLLAGHF